AGDNLDFTVGEKGDGSHFESTQVPRKWFVFNVIRVRNDSRPLSRGDLFLGESVDHGHTRVRDGVRVIVALDRAHEGLPSFEIEPLHLVLLAFNDVDGLWMQRGGPARKVGLADDAGRLCRIDDDEVIRGDRAQAYGVGGIRLVRT